MRYLNKFILTLLIFLFLFAKPLWAIETKTSYKKGVGVTFDPKYCDNKVDPTSCNDNLKNALQSLGITWFYNWRHNAKGYTAYGDAFEFVPMVSGAGGKSDHSYTQEQLNSFASIAANHPGSYWLIWNEPDLIDINGDGNPNNLNDDDIKIWAKIYKPLQEAIMTADHEAKLIIGGMAYYDYWNFWAGRFVFLYKNLYGTDPIFWGWHGHQYVCDAYDPTVWRSKITSFRNWINNHGGGEFWLTEFGCLSKSWSGISQIIVDQLGWMETYAGIQRYAWFSAGEGQYPWQAGNLFVGVPDQRGFGLSSLGQTYAQHPRNPNPTHTPTPTPTPISVINLEIGWNKIIWQSTLPENKNFSSIPTSCSTITYSANSFWQIFKKQFGVGNEIFSQGLQYSIFCSQLEQWGL